MLVLLSLALVCATAATSGYGSPTYNAPSYNGGHHGGHHGYYDWSSSSSSESGSSSEEHHHRRCKRLDKLNVPNPGFVYEMPKFSSLERRGKQYVKLSCPNRDGAWALIAGKAGSTASANNGVDVVKDSILLSAGVNIDFVARCHGRKTFAIANDGSRVKIEEVACVKVNEQPNTF